MIPTYSVSKPFVLSNPTKKKSKTDKSGDQVSQSVGPVQQP